MKNKKTKIVNTKSKKEKTKQKDVKPKVVKKKSNNLTNILLVILIVILLALFISTIITTKDNPIIYETIDQNNFDENNLVDVNFNVEVINDNNNSYPLDLNEITVPESELINEFLITEENIDDLRGRYYFVFNESLIFAYGFKQTKIGDVILEFKDYIIVYNVSEEDVKSVWMLESISN